MKKSILSVLLAVSLLTTLLAGCGSSASTSSGSNAASVSGTENIVLNVGATPAPHAEILEFIQPALAEQGITLEITVFNDYIVPNTSLADGSIDANFFQHLPYLENFNIENGTDLISAGGIHIEPFAIYPGKTATLEDLQDGATIAIPNDATNEGRALLLLEDLGLITLNEDAGLEATPNDVATNPHNLQFLELEAAQLPVTLEDVDFAVINGNYAIGAGIRDTALATEGAESPYVNVVAVRNGDETRPEIQALIAALTSEDVRAFITERYEGEVIPVF